MLFVFAWMKNIAKQKTQWFANRSNSPLSCLTGTQDPPFIFPLTRTHTVALVCVKARNPRFHPPPRHYSSSPQKKTKRFLPCLFGFFQKLNNNKQRRSKKEKKYHNYLFFVFLLTKHKKEKEKRSQTTLRLPKPPLRLLFWFSEMKNKKKK